MTTATHPNLTYRCPHCGTALEVDPRLAEEMLTCPNEACGKPFRADVPSAEPLPEPAAAKNGAGAPVAQLAPPAPVPDAELQTVHLAMLRRYPLRVAAYLVLGALALWGIAAGLTWDWPLLWIAGLIVLAVVGFRAVVWWLRSSNTALRITSTKCILENGVFAKETVEVPREDVVDLQVSQSLLGRVLNVGDILIRASKGEQTRLIRVMAVPDPEAVARLIRDANGDSQSSAGSKATTSAGPAT